MSERRYKGRRGEKKALLRVEGEKNPERGEGEFKCAQTKGQKRRILDLTNGGRRNRTSDGTGELKRDDVGQQRGKDSTKVEEGH